MFYKASLKTLSDKVFFFLFHTRLKHSCCHHFHFIVTCSCLKHPKQKSLLFPSVFPYLEQDIYKDQVMNEASKQTSMICPCFYFTNTSNKAQGICLKSVLKFQAICIVSKISERYTNSPSETVSTCIP